MTAAHYAAFRRWVSPLGASLLVATPAFAAEPPCEEYLKHYGTGAMDGATKGSDSTLADGCPLYDQPWHEAADADDTRVVVIDKLAELASTAADRRAVLYVIDTRTGEISFRAPAAHGTGPPFDAPKRSKGDRHTPEGSFEMLDVRRTRDTVAAVDAQEALQDRKTLLGDWFVLLSYPKRDRTLANGADSVQGGAIGLHGGSATAPTFKNFPNGTAGCIRLFDVDLQRFLDAGLLGLPVRIVHRIDDVLRKDLWSCEPCNAGQVREWLNLDSVPDASDVAKAIAASPSGTQPRSEAWTLEAVASTPVVTGRTAASGAQGVAGLPTQRGESGSGSQPDSGAGQGPTGGGGLPAGQSPTIEDKPTVVQVPTAAQGPTDVETQVMVPVQPSDTEGPPEARGSAIAYPPLRHPAWGDPVHDALAGVGAARGVARRDGYDALMRRYWGPRPAIPGEDLPGQAVRIYADPHCQIELSAQGGLRYDAGLTIHTVAYTTKNCRLVWHHEEDAGGIARFVGYVRVP